jgi:glucosamine--fructose-6-phosphate aminotransferase (isomerizing)
LKAETLIITDPGNTEARKRAARFLLMPIEPRGKGEPRDLYTPIPYIVPAQLFAGHLASMKGLNPNSPRTLKDYTNSVTSLTLW